MTITAEALREAQRKMTNFYDAVKDMREAQRDYFKTRSTSSLHRAKELERTVDKIIKEVEAHRVGP